jgi:hypothetical protein
VDPKDGVKVVPAGGERHWRVGLGIGGIRFSCEVGA